MPRYRVKEVRCTTTVYEVEADDEEAAVATYGYGEAVDGDDGVLERVEVEQLEPDEVEA